MIKIISLPVWNKLGVEFETSVFSPQRKIFNSSTDKYGSWKVQQLLKQISFHKVFLTFCKPYIFKVILFWYNVLYNFLQTLCEKLSFQNSNKNFLNIGP